MNIQQAAMQAVDGREVRRPSMPSGFAIRWDGMSEELIKTFCTRFVGKWTPTLHDLTANDWEVC